MEEWFDYKVKTDKTRITMTICCNATGSSKISIFIIDKSAQPILPFEYKNQKSAWMSNELGGLHQLSDDFQVVITLVRDSPLAE